MQCQSGFCSTRRSVCDSHYHFFCSFVSRKFRFFPKKSAIFRENLRKILKFFEKLGHEKNAEFVVLEIPKKLFKLNIWRKNSAKFWQFLRNFGKKTTKISAIFNENFEIRERCKGVHCVDLGESFPTSI